MNNFVNNLDLKANGISPIIKPTKETAMNTQTQTQTQVTLQALKEIKSRCEGCVEGGFRADPAAFIKIAGNAIAEVEGGEV